MNTGNTYHKGMLVAVLAITGLMSAGSQAFADVTRDDEPKIERGLVTPVRQWQDNAREARAVVLLLHGFPEHGLLFDKLATQLAGEGYIVYAPDLRGLGRAYDAGWTKIDYDGSLNDVTRLAKRIRKDHKDLKLYVGGESMGGALAIRLAATEPDLVDGLMLSGPAVKLESHYARLIPRSLLNVVSLGLVKVDFTNQIKKFYSKDPRIASELLNDSLVRKKFGTGELLEARTFPNGTEKFIGRLPSDLPVLVLQATDDKQTNPKQLYLFDAKLRSKDLTYVIYSYGGHTILQTSFIDSFSTKTLTDWLDKHAPAVKTKP